MGRQQLTEIDRRRVRTLKFEALFTYSRITALIGFSEKQIRNALISAVPTPRSGRPPVMTASEVEELIEYISASRQNRRRSYTELSDVLFDIRFGEAAIRSTLKRLGYRRYVALLKPPISENNRLLRLAFAHEHRDWSLDQWKSILWSDETWMTYGRHRKTYVTRKKSEKLEDTCVVDREQRKQGWLFWGCFSGYRKGPGLFWEKEWGSISGQTYNERIVPLISGWITLNTLEQQQQQQRLVLMHDNAPAHTGRDVLAEIQSRGITVVKWPPYSPDLNPIETCWNWMKDYIEDMYGDDRKPSYDTLRLWVQQAWDALPEEFLKEQLESMQERMDMVIMADGKHTRF